MLNVPVRRVLRFTPSEELRLADAAVAAAVASVAKVIAASIFRAIYANIARGFSAD